MKDKIILAIMLGLLALSNMAALKSLQAANRREVEANVRAAQEKHAADTWRSIAEENFAAMRRAHEDIKEISRMVRERDK